MKICRLKKMCAVEHAQDDAYGTEVGQRYYYRYVAKSNMPRQYSNMAPRLSGQTSIFGTVFFVSSLFREFRDKINFEKLQFYP